MPGSYVLGSLRDGIYILTQNEKGKVVTTYECKIFFRKKKK